MVHVAGLVSLNKKVSMFLLKAILKSCTHLLLEVEKDVASTEEQFFLLKNNF